MEFSGFLDCLFLLVQISYVLICLLHLILITLLYKDYIRSKPILSITLTDLINTDLAVTYCGTFASSASIHLLISLNAWVPIPRPLAAVACFSLSAWGVCWAAYLSVGAVVQFVLVRARSMDLFSEEVADGSVKDSILTAVGGFPVTSVSCLGVAFGPANAFPLFYAILGETEKETSR